MDTLFTVVADTITATGGDLFDVIAANFGVSMTAVLQVAGASVLIVNAVKAKYGAQLGGWKTYAAVVGCNLVLAFALAWPGLGTGLATGILASVGSLLGWTTVRAFKPNGLPPAPAPPVPKPPRRK